MPTNFANTVLDLEGLRDSIAKHLELVPGAERFLAPLDTAITKIRSLSNTRNTLIADKQRVTQELNASVTEAQNVAIDARAVIRGEVGARSEKLVEFGITPLRKRSRRSGPVEEPDSAKQAPK